MPEPQPAVTPPRDEADIPYHPPPLPDTDNADPADFISEEEPGPGDDDLAPRPREYDEATLQSAQVERNPLDDDPNLRRQEQAALGQPENPPRGPAAPTAAAGAADDPLAAAVAGGDHPTADPPGAPERGPEGDPPPEDYELQPKHLALAGVGLVAVGVLLGLVAALALSPLLPGHNAPAAATATNLPELDKALRGPGGERAKLQSAVQVARNLGNALTQAQRPRTLLAFSRGSQFDPDAVDSTAHAVNQINKARTEAIWVTNAPTNDVILRALANRKPQGLSVLIIVGANTPDRFLTGALAQGPAGNAFSVFRSPLPFEDPTNYLLIDESLYVDLSRIWTTTESVEPDVAHAARDWIKYTLLAKAIPIVNDRRLKPAAGSGNPASPR